MTAWDVVTIAILALTVFVGAILVPFWIINDEMDQRDRVGRYAPDADRRKR